MEKIKFVFLILLCLFFCGCSIPSSARYKEIYSFTTEEKMTKGGFGGKKNALSIKDFREVQMYDEDIAALKEDVEGYIAEYPQTAETIKTNLRELKVTEGENKGQVELLLGEPDKISKRAKSEVWIYRIQRMRAFTFFIFPVFFAHEGYYLYFKDGILSKIERHYPEQIIHQASGPGVDKSLPR